MNRIPEIGFVNDAEKREIFAIIGEMVCNHCKVPEKVRSDKRKLELVNLFADRLINQTMKEKSEAENRFADELHRLHAIRRSAIRNIRELQRVEEERCARAFYKDLCGTVYKDPNKTCGGIMSICRISEIMGISPEAALNFMEILAKYHITERQGGMWVV